MRNSIKLKEEHGRDFTLIELLVVISIVSLLASVVLTTLNSAQAKARDSRRLSDVRQIQNALELYRNDNGRFPPRNGANTEVSADCGDNRWDDLES